MDSFNRYTSQNYAPSAPTLPDNYGQEPLSPPTHQPSSSPYKSHGSGKPNYSQPQAGHGPPSSSYGSTYGQEPTSSSLYKSHGPGQPNYSQSQPPPSVYGYSSGPSYGGNFAAGTDPEVIRSFQMVDKDRSGFIDERELQEALSFGYQKFSIRTVQLLMFLFRNPMEPSKMGPKEFSALWKCLGEWRAIFERFDKDRSGKIDTTELRDALYSLGYAVPHSVLQVLISKYDDGSGRRGELNFDSFVECGMIVKGLTEKFKEKDTRYTGSATLDYNTFMTIVIPFIVP
ncbi:hypothetical protein IFM89_031071 [Coptis chinensis]|uniref:EF-hand domain-containing protein n=1 Tax=Coptis chinensis TaxID=261450 RepID=A0A835H9K1_9MAGN|nr:hypothetical protein IFM89_031071 [Coptis chinensis]